MKKLSMLTYLNKMKSLIKPLHNLKITTRSKMKTMSARNKRLMPTRTRSSSKMSRRSKKMQISSRFKRQSKAQPTTILMLKINHNMKLRKKKRWPSLLKRRNSPRLLLLW